MSEEVLMDQPLDLRLGIACIGSCSCETKTHEARFHNPDCLYRVLQDAVARIEKLEADCDKYIWQVRDTCTRAEKAERDNQRLEAENRQMREALEDVQSPVNYLRKYAEREGWQLGANAYVIANDLHFVQKIARQCLASQPPETK